MNAERLAEIRERAEKATPGPWTLGDERDDYEIVQWDINIPGPGKVYDRFLVTHGSDLGEDAEFIAHARVDIPDLLAEVDRLTRELADLRRAATRSLAYTNTALGQLPGQCRYHGSNLDRDEGRDGACCDTGRPSLFRRDAVEANRALNFVLSGGPS